MTELSDMFLTSILVYGPSALGLALLLAALGAPIPATMLVIATGAFVQQDLVSGWVTGSIAVLASVMGDSACYGIGRFGRSWIPAKIVQHQTWRRAENTFHQRGGAAIFLTRFLLTPLALPTNLIAGGNHYAYRRFLLFDIPGEMTWVLLYGGLGFLFADSWEILSSMVSNIAGALVGVVAVAGGGYMAYRTWVKPAMTRRLVNRQSSL